MPRVLGHVTCLHNCITKISHFYLPFEDVDMQLPLIPKLCPYLNHQPLVILMASPFHQVHFVTVPPNLGALWFPLELLSTFNQEPLAGMRNPFWSSMRFKDMSITHSIQLCRLDTCNYYYHNTQHGILFMILCGISINSHFLLNFRARGLQFFLVPMMTFPRKIISSLRVACQKWAYQLFSRACVKEIFFNEGCLSECRRLLTTIVYIEMRYITLLVSALRFYRMQLLIRLFHEPKLFGVLNAIMEKLYSSRSVFPTFFT